MVFFVLFPAFQYCPFGTDKSFVRLPTKTFPGNGVFSPVSSLRLRIESFSAPIITSALNRAYEYDNYSTHGHSRADRVQSTAMGRKENGVAAYYNSLTARKKTNSKCPGFTNSF
jgi:hypothetical protein